MLLYRPLLNRGRSRLCLWRPVQGLLGLHLFTNLLSRCLGRFALEPLLLFLLLPHLLLLLFLLLPHLLLLLFRLLLHLLLLHLASGILLSALHPRFNFLLPSLFLSDLIGGLPLLAGCFLLTTSKLLLLSLLLHLSPSSSLLLRNLFLLTFESRLLLRLAAELLLRYRLVCWIVSLHAFSPQLAQLAPGGLVALGGSLGQRSHLPVALNGAAPRGVRLCRNLRQSIFTPGLRNLSYLIDLQPVLLTPFRYLLDAESVLDITSRWQNHSTGIRNDPPIQRLLFFGRQTRRPPSFLIPQCSPPYAIYRKRIQHGLISFDYP